MERTISVEERIRKAEEIYNRRRQDNVRIYGDRSNRNETKYQDSTVKRKITKKILIQIAVCLVIYLALYTANYNNTVFSEDVRKQIDGVLAYDISFENLYSNFKGFVNDENNFIYKFLHIDNNESSGVEDLEEGSNEQVEQNTDSNDSTSENEEINSEAEAVGGAIEETVTESKTQEELDVEHIKNNCSIIWPLKGTITSRYGTREATEIVTANHYGLDIGGNTGSDIVSAMDGVVTLASSEGDYGKHIKIENSDISTLYAHCSKLCVTEGTQIKQGQKIAEVGATGRATGPHLHFEIRVEDRKINPELILN